MPCTLYHYILILSRRKKRVESGEKGLLFWIRAAVNPLLIRLCSFWTYRTRLILQKNFLKKPQKSLSDFWNFATILYRYTLALKSVLSHPPFFLRTPDYKAYKNRPDKQDGFYFLWMKFYRSPFSFPSWLAKACSCEQLSSFALKPTPSITRNGLHSTTLMVLPS